jgi:alpha-glucosidase
VLLVTLRGSPFLYQGEELGLLDAEIPADRAVDPGGRDGCRAPIPWDGTADHGWPGTGGADPWLPFPPDADIRNHAAQRADPSSILHFYRRLLALRHAEPALRLGRFERLEPAEGVLGYRRVGDGASFVVLINLTGQAVTVGGRSGPSAVPDGLVVRLSSDGVGERSGFDGTIGADQALVLGG